MRLEVVLGDVLEAEWDYKFGLLKLWVEEKGDAKVTQGTEYLGVKLGMWVSAQRQRVRKGKMSQYNIDKLNELGFVWDATKR